MKQRMLFVVTGMIIVFVYTFNAIVGAQNSEDPSAGMSPDQQAMMAEWMKIASPGEAHKHLDYFVGTWKTKTKIYMGGPGSAPMESDGQSEIKWVLNGRFIMDEHKGTMMGMPYEGIGLTGYDNYRNLYIGSWCSNQGTNMLAMSGMRHPTTGVFTYYGEMDEPGLNVIGRTVKYVTRIVDEDHYTFEIIDLHAGDDYKVIELSYERIK